MIKTVDGESSSKHYFVISGPEWSDNRDLDQLAEFIEGKTGEKDKKRTKKKRKNKDSLGNTSERGDQERIGEGSQMTTASPAPQPPAQPRLENAKEQVKK